MADEIRVPITFPSGTFDIRNGRLYRDPFPRKRNGSCLGVTRSWRMAYQKFLDRVENRQRLWERKGGRL